MRWRSDCYCCFPGISAKSWDITFAELRGRAAYEFYFNGFDKDQFNAAVPLESRYYGPLADLLITIAQGNATDVVERLEIRTALQALISLSCLIPIFLIAARVVSKPLALVGVLLVAATPAFLGHAFINPKDSVFASVFLWALYLILECFDGGRRPGYRALIGLGVLLGVVTSMRYMGGYLLLLIPLAAIVLPALQSEDRARVLNDIRSKAALHAGGAAVLLLAFAISYLLSMPALLADLRTQTLFDIFHKFANYPWTGTVRYFGKDYPATNLPWHYLYGYMLVQLPLYYHLFLVTVLAALLVSPHTSLNSFREFLKGDYRAASTFVILIAALTIPLLLILVMRPPLYDGFRHILFLIPVSCLLLYFGFLGVLANLPRFARIAIGVIAVLCLGEAVAAEARWHPYEYAYYNPLIKPQGKFELDYWGTSFRELADRLNRYAQDHEGEKITVSVCGPPHTLATFLDAKRFEIVSDDSRSKDLRATLNRFGCISLVRGAPTLITVMRGESILAVVTRGDF